MCCKKHILGYVKLKTTCRIQKTNLLFCSNFGKTSDGLFLFCFGQLKEIWTNRKKSKGELSCVWPTRKDLRFNNQRLLKLKKRRLKIKILKTGEKKKKTLFWESPVVLYTHSLSEILPVCLRTTINHFCRVKPPQL